MKKIILSVVVLGTIAFTSCSSDDGADFLQQQLAQEAVCDSLWDNQGNAASAYFSDNSTANCTSYKEATQALLNSGAACVDGSEEYLQLTIDGLNCAN